MPPKGTIEMTAPKPEIYQYVPHQMAEPKKPKKGLKSALIRSNAKNDNQ